MSYNRLEKSKCLYKILTTSTNNLNKLNSTKHTGSKAYKFMSIRDIDTFTIDEPLSIRNTTVTPDVKYPP